MPMACRLNTDDLAQRSDDDDKLAKKSSDSGEIKLSHIKSPLQVIDQATADDAALLELAIRRRDAAVPSIIELDGATRCKWTPGSPPNADS